MKLILGSISDVGLHREHNEDNYILCEDLSEKRWNLGSNTSFHPNDMGSVLFIADGMGGASAGEIASRIAMESVIEIFNVPEINEIKSEHTFLSEALLKAHYNIVESQKNDPELKGMGTTAILAWIKKGKIFFSWSGDSRAYIFNKNRSALPITDDHSLVWEMVLENKILAEEARSLPESHIILQCLGDPLHVPVPGFREYKLEKGDKILLCSDGLNSMIPDEQIKSICEEAIPIKERLLKLVGESNEAGGLDNITIILADVIEIDDTDDPERIHENSKSLDGKIEKPSEDQLRKKDNLKKIILLLLFLLVYLIWLLI